MMYIVSCQHTLTVNNSKLRKQISPTWQFSISLDHIQTLQLFSMPRPIPKILFVTFLNSRQTDKRQTNRGKYNVLCKVTVLYPHLFYNMVCHMLEWTTNDKISKTLITQNKCNTIYTTTTTLIQLSTVTCRNSLVYVFVYSVIFSTNSRKRRAYCSGCTVDISAAEPCFTVLAACAVRFLIP